MSVVRRRARVSPRAIAIAACAAGGVLLLVVNLYGLTRSLRHPDLAQETLTRFPNDREINLEQMWAELPRRAGESQRDFALRINRVIQQGISHIDWADPRLKDKYHAQVPVWENYLLHALGYVDPAHFRPYRFRNPQRTIERGVGICGDVACVLSHRLEREGIESSIVVYPGHVVVEANLGSAAPQWWLLDPDFGVAFEGDRHAFRDAPERIEEAYRAQGYSEAEVADLRRIMTQEPVTFDSAFDFSPRRALLEEAMYVLKWLLPLALLAAPALLWRRKRGERPIA